jgi:recombination protein RecA
MDSAEVDYFLLRRTKSEDYCPLTSPFPPCGPGCACIPMNSRAAALRLQVETALAGRVVAPLEYRNRQVVETVSAGIAAVDELTGGLPRGCLTEIFGEPCSGRTSLLLAALAARTGEAEVCALVDGRDSFDPAAALAAGVNLRQLLWVRCKNIDQALRATDLLIQGGGFGLLALDLSDIAPRLVRQVPLNVWFRFRRAVENTPMILFLLAQESNAKTCASLVLRMEGEAGVWRETAENATSENAATNAQEKREHAEGNLLGGGKSWAELVRSRMQSEDGQPKARRVMKNRVLSIDARRIDSTRMDGAKFAVKTEWNYLRERDD